MNSKIFSQRGLTKRVLRYFGRIIRHKKKFGDYPGEMRYFCPQCESFFVAPERWASPCCGATIVIMRDGYTQNCPECKEVVKETYEIPECPFCKNIGGGQFIQPDLIECHRSNIDACIRRGGQKGAGNAETT